MLTRVLSNGEVESDPYVIMSIWMMWEANEPIIAVVELKSDEQTKRSYEFLT